MKKYFLISEVEEILGKSQPFLRNLEKSNSLKIKKIEGRRYYKISDIDKIASIIGITYNVNDSKINKKDIIHKDDKKLSEKLQHPTPANATEIHQPKSLIKAAKEAQLDMFSVLEKIKKTSTEKNTQSSLDLMHHKDILMNRRSNLLKLIG